MKWALVFSAIVVAVAALVFADDKSSQKMPEDWARLAAPGEAHARLAQLAGKWRMTLKYSDMAGKPAESTGSAEFNPIMGGRFIEETVTCTFLGEPFEWKAWHGYDNQKKQHISSWVDNFGTAIDEMTGTWDEASKTLTYSGDVDDTGSGPAKVRWAMRFESPKKVVIVMHQGEEKVMEIVMVKE
jgi:hypothetical protein